MKNKPILYLLPNLLADVESHREFLPASVDETVASLDFLIAESEKAARRFLKRFSYPPPKTFREIPIYLLNEHSSLQDKKDLIHLIIKSGKWGLISDCGLPCIADPGADLVLMAREKGIEIISFTGPSSLVYALTLSGLGGQYFTFHGYLPQKEQELIASLKEIQKLSKEKKSTHLFIETPYRNDKTFQILLKNLDPATWICLACDLTGPNQEVATLKVKEWKQRAFSIGKRPCVFVLRSY